MRKLIVLVLVSTILVGCGRPSRPEVSIPHPSIPNPFSEEPTPKLTDEQAKQIADQVIERAGLTDDHVRQVAQDEARKVAQAGLNQDQVDVRIDAKIKDLAKTSDVVETNRKLDAISTQLARMQPQALPTGVPATATVAGSSTVAPTATITVTSPARATAVATSTPEIGATLSPTVSATPVPVRPTASPVHQGQGSAMITIPPMPSNTPTPVAGIVAPPNRVISINGVRLLEVDESAVQSATVDLGGIVPAVPGIRVRPEQSFTPAVDITCHTWHEVIVNGEVFPKIGTGESGSLKVFQARAGTWILGHGELTCTPAFLENSWRDALNRANVQCQCGPTFPFARPIIRP